MTTMVANLTPLTPEIFVLVMACVTLLVGLFASKQRFIAYYFAQITLIVAAILTWHSYHQVAAGQVIYAFHRTFVLDRLAVILKLFIYLSVFFTFVYSRAYNALRKIPATEFYVLGLLSTLGMMVLVSGHSLLTIFMGVELLSLPTYAMVAMRRNQMRCVEAAMKYFIIGAVVTAIMLYGMSMVFGATKTLDLSQIATIVSTTPISDNLILIFGLVFIIAAIMFKLGAAPFHLWVPDVYDGAPNSVTLFIAAAPKIAAFGMAVRLLVQALPALHGQWQEMLIVVAILSMAIGNLTAIMQTSLKRLLAYSSIAHMGYMLLGLVCATPRGYAAAMFYIITYSLMTLAAFGMILLMSRAGFEADNIEDLAGLNNRNPWLAFMMLLVMFSMAGIPPIVGFIAKVGVLEALINAHLVWLAVVALLFAIIGAYYYLRVVKVMYFGDGDRELPSLRPSWDNTIAISLNGLAVLLVGVFPGLLFTICHLVFF